MKVIYYKFYSIDLKLFKRFKIEGDKGLPQALGQTKGREGQYIQLFGNCSDEQEK